MKGKRFDSVWDAIEDLPAAAVNMKARADLMIATREVVESWKITQAKAAKRLGVNQPRMNDLVRGRIDKFSLDALMKLASRAGLVVRIEVIQSAA
jgi:predicted XRE-type DNA-binding protein